MASASLFLVSGVLFACLCRQGGAVDGFIWQTPEGAKSSVNGLNASQPLATSTTNSSASHSYTHNGNAIGDDGNEFVFGYDIETGVQDKFLAPMKHRRELVISKAAEIIPACRNLRTLRSTWLLWGLASGVLLDRAAHRAIQACRARSSMPPSSTPTLSTPIDPETLDSEAFDVTLPVQAWRVQGRARMIVPQTIEAVYVAITLCSLCSLWQYRRLRLTRKRRASKAKAPAVSKLELDPEFADKLSASLGTAAPKGAGKGKGKGPPPAKGAGKGKAPPYSAKGKGKSKEVSNEESACPNSARRSSAADMPFGQRIHLVQPTYDEPDESTVFGELGHTCKESKIDPQLMTALWSSTSKDTNKSFVPRKPVGISLLDSARAQNVAIQLSRLTTSTEEIRECVQALDFSTHHLTVDDIEVVTSLKPTLEEANKLMKYKDQVESLRRVEQQLMPLCLLSTSRLKFVKIALSHEAAHADVLQRCHTWQWAAEEARSSAQFRELLGVVLQIGNFINHGVAERAEGTVRGFAIESLQVLASFKKRGVSALHYLVLMMKRSNENFLHLLSEGLGHVHDASRERLANLQADVTRCQEDCRFAQAFLDELEADEAGEGDRATVAELIKTLKFEEAKVKEAFETATKTADEVQLYFSVAKPVKIPPPEQFFNHISCFLQQFGAGWAEIASGRGRWRQLVAKGRAAQEGRKPAAGSSSGGIKTRTVSHLKAAVLPEHGHGQLAKPKKSSPWLSSGSAKPQSQSPAARERKRERVQLERQNSAEVLLQQLQREFAMDSLTDGSTASSTLPATPQLTTQESSKGVCEFHVLDMDSDSELSDLDLEDAAEGVQSNFWVKAHVQIGQMQMKRQVTF